MRRVWLASLLLGALSAGAASAQTGGFDPLALEAAARRETRADPAVIARRQLAASADILRAGLILDPARALAVRTPTEQLALVSALGPGDAAAARRVSWFMRGATVRAFELRRGGDSLVGLYNPLADAWLITRWVQVAEDWRITDAAFAVDPAGAAGAPPPWTASPDSWPAALADAHARNLAAVESWGQEAFARSAAGREAAYARVDGAGGGLSVWAGDAGRRSKLESVQATLRAGQARRIGQGNPGAAANIDALPGGVRATLSAMAAFPSADSEDVVFASPLFPELLIVAVFEKDGGPLRHLTLVNLANATARPAGGSGR